MTPEEIEAREEKEKSYLFFKTMQCNICEKSFKWRTTKSGKLRLIGQDKDLRQKYAGIDVNRYHVVSCPHCGYTALERYFTAAKPSICVKAIKELLKTVTPLGNDPEIITYKQAFERYHLALQCASGKKQSAKASEQAYICLKTAWLIRGEKEELLEQNKVEEAKQLGRTEGLFLKNSYNQFIQAKMQESYPICGMNESSLDLLLAALAMANGERTTALKLLSSVITSLSASSGIKDKARTMKEELVKRD